MKYFKAIFPYGGAFADDAILPLKRNVLDERAFIHFCLDEWPEKIFETAGIYAVSEDVRRKFQGIDATGVNFVPCKVSKSSQFYQTFPEANKPLLNYFWMLVDGRPGADLWVDSENKLFVSERVAGMLQDMKIQDLDLLPV